jgi:hypothetical protein
MKYNTLLNLQNIASLFELKKFKFEIRISPDINVSPDINEAFHFLTVHVSNRWIMTITDKDEMWTHHVIFDHLTKRLDELGYEYN